MKFALAGNPNSGKTTLFNALTGSTAHVGNWPGVTVDKKEGTYKKLSEKITIVDLPGIYSLSPYTPEEVISRNYILNKRPDAIINIVDATNLERNLYLSTQLIETDIPMVIVLNMIDVVEKSGDKIDIESLEKKLNIPVVAISALKGKGIKELMERVYKTASENKQAYSVLDSSTRYKDLYNQILRMYKEKNIDNAVFRTVKMLEGDQIESKAYPEIHKVAISLESEMEEDFEAVVADARYKFITKQIKPAITKKATNNNLSKSDKIDKVLTHRIFGIPVFLLIMFLVFHLTFSENLFYLSWAFAEGSFDSILGTDAINSPGVILFNLMDIATASLGDLIGGWLENAPVWISGLIGDGLLGGIFAVLSFIPQIMLLFFFLSILEDSGYMARVAFLMDRAFRKFGLSGKAFLPLLMCFGCAIPGIMATRTLENEKERRMSIMLTPFFSCGAKLPIWATFAAIMFLGQHGDLIVFSMYILGIAIAIISAIILKKTSLKGETPPFIMELPSYHLPKAKNTLIHLWEKLKHYLYRAATIIAGAIVVIWFLSNFSFSLRMVEDSGNSILGILSKGITWLFVPLGFGMGEEGWKFVVAAFTGLIAKEMVVATMGTFAGMADGEAVLDMSSDELVAAPIAVLISTISIPAAFAFMAFNLLSVPCMAAVAAASGELQSKKKLWGAIGYWMSTAYVVSMLIYWIGTYWWIGLILLGIAACVFVFFKVKKWNTKRVKPVQINEYTSKA